MADHRWAELSSSPVGPPAPRRRGVVAAAVVSVLALLLAARGELGGAVLLVVGATLVGQLSALAPAVVERVAERVAAVVGGLLLATVAVLLAPVSALLWVLGIDPLQPGDRRSTPSGWGRAVRGVARAAMAVVVLAAGWAVVDEVAGDDPVIVPRGGVQDITFDAEAEALQVVPGQVAISRETGRQHQEALPFLVVRDADEDGRHVHLRDGVRRSYQPAAGGDDLPTVWFFGGSTMFGSGQRDLHTIPSEVARLAESEGRPVRVVNFGQKAWVNWQETLLLAQLLTERDPPDLAVFYDGWNDVLLQHERVRWPEDDPTAPSHLFADAAYDVQRQLVASVGGPTSPPDPGDLPATAEAAADALVGLYRRGIDLARHLGEAYGFDVAHFWQPTLFTRELTPGEGVLLDTPGLDTDGFFELTALARDRLPAGVEDLGGALDGEPTPVFYDPAHTNEVGARLVAAAMQRSLPALGGGR